MPASTSFWQNFDLKALYRLGLCLLILVGATGLLAQDEEDPEEDPAIEDVYYDSKDLYYDGLYAEAKDGFHKALEMSRTSELASGYRVSAIYMWLANSYARLRMHQPALLYIDSAEMEATRIYGPDDEYVADILLERNLIESQMMHLQDARKTALRAMKIYENIYGPESEAVGIMNMNLALDLYKMDEYEEAEARFLRAKELFDKTMEPDDENINRFYNNMGMLYRKKKDYAKALEYAEIAMEYKLKHYGPDHPAVSKYYHNLADAQYEMGNMEEALKNYTRATEIMRLALGEDHPEYGGSLGDLAWMQIEMGNPDTAYQMFLKVNSIIAGRLGKNHPYAVAGLSDLAVCMEEMGRLDEAIRYVKQAISLLENDEGEYFPDLFACGTHLAYLYKKQGHYKECRQVCDSLLEVLLDRIEQQGAVGYQTEYPFLILDVLEERGDSYWLGSERTDEELLRKAWADYAESLDIIDGLRREITTEESQYHLHEESVWLYDECVKVAIALHTQTGDERCLADALKISERSKAAVLRSAMLDRYATAFGGISEEYLVEVTAYDDRIYALEQQIREASEGEHADTLAQWHRTLVELHDQRDRVIERIQLEYPQYYSIRYEEPELNIDDVRASLAGTSKAIISYYFDDEGGHAFYLSPGTFRHAAFDWDDSRKEQIRAFGSKESVSRAGGFGYEGSKELFDLLVAPFWDALDAEGISRLVISPHAELCYLPFDLLRVPGAGGEDSWLIEQYAVSYIPSIRMFDQIHEPVRHEIAYAGFAPVYDDAVWEVGDLAMRSSVAPLPATEAEIIEGQHLFGGMANIREQATVDAFKRAAPKASIIHLATHATVFPDSPLDSYLHFHADSTSANRKCSMFEIYRSDIPADLVLLSACETGLGDLRSGEGPMSLARAFQYAGARSVVMNQWLANDKSSKAITVSFLEHIADGQPKDIALQQAKLEYLHEVDPLLGHPFFWAGQSLYGDMEPLSKNLSKSNWGLAIIIGLIGLVIVGSFVFRDRLRRRA